MGIDTLEERIEKLLEEIKRSVEETMSRIEDMLERGDVKKAYNVWRSEGRRTLEGFRTKLREIKNMLEKAEMKDLDEISETINSYIEESIKKIEDLEYRVEEKLQKILKKKTKLTRTIFYSIKGNVLEILDSTRQAVEEARNRIEESLKELTDALTSSYVVSVRLRKADLEIIDELVEAGIFKSRSEAVAFFTRKGIELSDKWIEKIIEQVRKIKELRKSIREEIEKSIQKPKEQ